MKYKATFERVATNTIVVEADSLADATAKAFAERLKQVTPNSVNVEQITDSPTV